MRPLPTPPLLVVTDRRQVARENEGGGRAARTLEEVAVAAFHGGCRWLSLREKDLAADERVALLGRILAAAAPFGATVTVHEDVAAARSCAGVHLPARGDAAAARAVLGPGALVGVSAHSVAGALAAERAGADYVTLSPIHPTASKPGYGPALGPEALAEARAALRVPVVALGGIDRATVRGCLDAGAAGVAVMGSVMRADDPAAEIRALLGAAGFGS